MSEKIIIIGAGPAGYTAAIYAARAELAPVLFSGPQPGGQLMWTTVVENFPGFPEGVYGSELMEERMRKQAEKFGTKIIAENIASVDLSAQPFKIVSTSGAEYQTESLVIATGASAIWMNVPGEEQYKGKGVSVCATCDGFFFKGKEVAVVGGGDAAMEEALDLAKFANKVTVLVRGESLKASKIMQEKAQAEAKINFVWNVSVKEVLGDGTKVTGAKVLNSKTNEETEIKVDGIFPAIGHKPNTEMFKGQVEMDERGYIICKGRGSETSVPGVFAGGDVADTRYRQAITSAGTGCMAAMDAERWLQK
ncbi:MAG: thioredoxin-disulfide reductase [Patescibacteria group bacterium]|jgi:thioredoxin reductase (NADPH)